MRFRSEPEADVLVRLESVLTATISAIRQDTERRSRVFMNAVISNTSGAAAVGGITALISTFGVASTGTAIGSLSGAAATTAKLYWIGSIFGLGVATGGTILASTGLGVGVAAAFVGKRRLLGRVRRETDFEEHEKAIIAASVTMAQALRPHINSGDRPTDQELRFIATQVLLPVVEQIDQFWTHESIAAERLDKCRPFTETLAPFQLRKLARCRSQIKQIAGTLLAN